MRFVHAVTAITAAGLLSAAAYAGTFWDNQADFGPHFVDQRDTATGAIVSQFSLPGNGRGIVKVGSVLYMTTTSNAQVNKYDTSGNFLGTAFTVAGASALSEISYDGTNFWIADYSGTNQAYQYTPTGTLLKTIHLQNCGGFCDGLTFFTSGGNGRLISNRGDENTPGIYDVYDLNGTLLQAALITINNTGTGIAFDGTDFFVSSFAGRFVNVYDTSGTFVRQINTSSGQTGSSGIEGLSFDFAVVLGGVPEPGTMSMLGGGLVALAFAVKRFRKS